MSEPCPSPSTTPDDWYIEIENDDDSPYCECDLEPTEEEEFDNVCACCGKLLS